MKRIMKCCTFFLSACFIFGCDLVGQASSSSIQENSSSSNSIEGNDDDKLIISYDDDDLPSTGHYFSIKINKKIPRNSDNFNVTLSPGHIHGVTHGINESERSDLLFSAELYDETSSYYQFLTPFDDYLSDDYDIRFNYPDPMPDYLLPGDIKIIYSKKFDVSIPIAAINQEYGKLLFYFVQFNPLTNVKGKSCVGSIYYYDDTEFVYFSINSLKSNNN